MNRFELHVAESTVSTGTVSVGWCVPKEVFAALDKAAVKKAVEVRRSFAVEGPPAPDLPPDEARRRFEKQLLESRRTYLGGGLSTDDFEALEGKLPGQSRADVTADVARTRKSFALLSPEQRADVKALREAQAFNIRGKARKAADLRVSNDFGAGPFDGPHVDVIDEKTLPPEQQAILADDYRFEFDEEFDQVASGGYAAQKRYWDEKSKYLEKFKTRQGELNPKNKGYYDSLEEHYNQWLKVAPGLAARDKKAIEDTGALGAGAGEAAGDVVAISEHERIVNAELRRQATLNPLGNSALRLRREKAVSLASDEYLKRQRDGKLRDPEKELKRYDAQKQRGFDEGTRFQLRGGLRTFRERQQAARSGNTLAERGLSVRSKYEEEVLRLDAEALDYRARRSNARVPIPVGLAMGGSVASYYAQGTDSVPAMLTPGEFVMNRGAVNRVGVEALQMANGGLVGGRQSSANNASGLSVEVVAAVQKFGDALSSFSGLSGRLADSLDAFGGPADKLARALEGFPHVLTVSGQQRVEVIFNGAEVLSRITPELKGMMEDALKEKLNEVFRKYLPDAGVNIE